MYEGGGPDGPLLHGGGDDRHPRAVVVCGPAEPGEENHDAAPGKRPEPGIGNPPLKLVLRQADGAAEHHGQHPAQPRQRPRPNQQSRREGRGLHGEGSGDHPQQPGDAIGLQSPDEGGEEGGVVEGIHADHGDGEHRRRQRRAEKGGEEGRHARGGGNAQVPLVKAEEPPHPIAQSAPHLKSRPLPPGGAAAEVGNHRAQKDGRDQQQGDAAPQAHLIEDVVGALALGAQELVKPHNGKARQGQKIQQPGKFPPELRHSFHGHVEGRAHQTAGGPRRRGQQQPLPQGPGV